MAIRFAIFISGRGSNMLALSDVIAKTKDGKIALVAADKDCEGLHAAAARGYQTAHVPYKLQSKAESEEQLATSVEQANVDFILLAGFMKVLSPDFVARFKHKIINIHPSLLPKHKGLNTHQRALEAGDSEHGVSIHMVTAGLDEGPVIAQASIVIQKQEDASQLAARLLPTEHALYAMVTSSLINGSLTISGTQIMWHRLPPFDPLLGKLSIPNV